jgi:predicted transcriptional regulator
MIWRERGLNKLIRLDDDLAKHIEALAKQNKRSFNAEVTVALEQYANQQNRPDVQYWEGIKRMGKKK